MTHRLAKLLTITSACAVGLVSLSDSCHAAGTPDIAATSGDATLIFHGGIGGNVQRPGANQSAHADLSAPRVVVLDCGVAVPLAALLQVGLATVSVPVSVERNRNPQLRPVKL